VIGGPTNRVTPALGVQHYQTWTVAKPLATHTRPATCPEYGCDAHLNGWATIVPSSSDTERLLVQACTGQLDGHRRHYSEQPAGPGLTEYRFEPGQMCFAVATHRVSLERPELYIIRDGDWRQHLGNTRRYDRADQWTDDMSTRFDRMR
jgi:hypothetical protein